MDIIDGPDIGASPKGTPDTALVNGHFAAAAHLVQRGAPLTLATAVCLERWADVARLAETSDDREKQFAFILAALNGKAEAVRRMIDLGVDLKAPSGDLYSHATALHHAVCAGSLETVTALVDAGADLSAKDTAWHATPLGWAEHYVSEHTGHERATPYAEIVTHLRQRGAHT